MRSLGVESAKLLSVCLNRCANQNDEPEVQIGAVRVREPLSVTRCLWQGPGDADVSGQC